jgi:hypothetical protein
MIKHKFGLQRDETDVGNSAFCKVKLRVLGTTPEAATLSFVHKLRPDFEIPQVLHHTELDGRSYLWNGSFSDNCTVGGRGADALVRV